MDASLAHGFYKQYVRLAHSKDSAIDELISRQKIKQPRTRQAWLRYVTQCVRRLPVVVILGEVSDGEGKHADRLLLGVEHTHDPQGASAWCGVSLRLEARKFKISYYEVPILISNHAVSRVIQRLSLPDGRAALKALAPAFLNAFLYLDERAHSDLLLPAVGGAAIATRDQDDPQVWVLVTFVDKAKLRPKQVEELQAQWDLTRKAWPSLARDLPKQEGIPA